MFWVIWAKFLNFLNKNVFFYLLKFYSSFGDKYNIDVISKFTKNIEKSHQCPHIPKFL